MDWANERYVRFYISETADQAAWSWQARMLWPWLLNKADRAGVVATRTGARGVAALTRLPVDHVEAGIADLLVDGCVEEWSGGGYSIRNFIEAQNTPSSNSKRGAEMRARERVMPDANASKRKRTPANATKRPATPANANERGVTKSAPDLSRAELSREEDAGAPATSAVVVVEAAESAAHKPAVAAFDAAYRKAADGAKPTWNAATVGMVKKLVADHGAAEVEIRIGRLFGGWLPWMAGVPDVKALVGHFDRLVGPRPEPTRTNTRGGYAPPEVQRSLPKLG